MIPALALSSLASQLETAVVSSRRRLLSFQLAGILPAG